MAFKKQFKSDASIIIAGGDQSKMFPIGFRYSVGDEIYEVIKEFFEDNTHFRRVMGSDGSVDDMTVASIIRDFEQQPCKIETKVIEKMNITTAENKDEEKTDDENAESKK